MPAPTPFDPDALCITLCTLVRTVLSLEKNTVRPANQNMPTGSLSDQFGTILISEIDQPGRDSVVLCAEETDPPQTDLTEVVVGLRHVVALIQFYRSDAYSLVARLPAILQTSSAAALFRAQNIGYCRAGMPKNITGVVDTMQEPRAAIEIEFYVVAAESNTLGTFNELPTDLSVE